MSCDAIKSLLQDYVTRGLEPEKRRQVDAHLLECSACQRELAILTAVVSSLDHLPVLEPRPEFAGRVLGRLPPQRQFLPSPWWALALAPILGGLAWLLRPWLVGKLMPIADSLGRLSLPSTTAVTLEQLAIVPLAAIGLGLLVAGGAMAGWYFLQDN